MYLGTYIGGNICAGGTPAVRIIAVDAGTTVTAYYICRSRDYNFSSRLSLGLVDSGYTIQGRGLFRFFIPRFTMGITYAYIH